MPNVVLFAIREKVLQYILAPHGLDDELAGMSAGCFLHDGDGEREVALMLRMRRELASVCDLGATVGYILMT